MGLKFSDIEMAFEFVSSAPMTAHSAILCTDTGEIYYSSDGVGKIKSSLLNKGATQRI